MNVQFPGRKQYLFDTFEGFCRNQIEQEHADGLISKWFTKEGLFADTGEQQVLNRLPNKEQVIICKGLFEEVAPTIAEDTFAFVSLDMDLYAPMLAGLEYFYPRLNPGGYMFLHDYNHSDILGVKKVILDFQAAHGVRLLKVPLPDEGGTVVLLK